MSLQSQTDSVKTFNMPEMRIFQKEKGREVAYEFKDDVNKFLITNSFVSANPDIYKYKVSIDDITKIGIRNGTHFWGGAGVMGSVGFIIGFFFWGFADLSPHPTGHHEFSSAGAFIGGLVTTIPFGLIGGLFGLLIPKYDEYKIFGIDKSRYNSTIKIFRKNRI